MGDGDEQQLKETMFGTEVYLFDTLKKGRTPKRLKPVSKNREVAKYFGKRICRNRWCVGFRDQNNQRQIYSPLTKEAFSTYCDEKGFMPYLSSKKMEGYLDQTVTRDIYYKSSPTAEEIILTCDIDCQKALKKGSAEGAKAFALKVNEYLGSNLYWETSDGGIGQQGIIPIHVGKMEPSERHKLAKELEAKLKALMISTGADIENVEVKGLCPIFEWKKQGNKFIPAVVNDGIASKLPRKATIQQLKAAKVLDWQEVINLPDLLPKNEQVKIKSIKPSSAGAEFNKSQLNNLDGYRRFAKKQFYLNNLHGWKVKSWDITEEDLTLFLFTVSNVKCQNNAMPTSVIQEKWKWLNDNGYSDRGYVHSRFREIRNWLSKNGLIDWVNENYSFGEINQACRWGLSEEVLDGIDCYLNIKQEEEAIDTNYLKNGEGYNLRPILVWNPQIISPKRWDHQQQEELMAVFGNY